MVNKIQEKRRIRRYQGKFKPLLEIIKATRCAGAIFIVLKLENRKE